MKNLLFYFIGLFIFTMSCKNKDVIVCEPSVINITENGVTSIVSFAATADTKNAIRISEINIYTATDSAETYLYTYSNGMVTKIDKKNATNTLVNTDSVFYNGAEIDRIDSYKNGTTKDQSATFFYTSGKVSKIELAMKNGSGTFSKIAHTAFTYGAGSNASVIEYYLDLSALFTVVFGGTPTTYSPQLFVTTNKTFDSSPNPFAGEIFAPSISQLSIDMPYSANNFTSINTVDANQKTSSQNYTITYNTDNLAETISEDTGKISYGIQYSCN